MNVKNACLGLLLCAITIQPAFAQGDDKQEKERRLRILLAASAPTREYQFVRTHFVRAGEKVELSIHMQDADANFDEGIDPKFQLKEFPDLKERKYDLVIAFDVDWFKVRKQESLQDWVHEGGGLIVVAGPAHSFKLGNLFQLSKVMPLTTRDTRLHKAPLDGERPHVLQFREEATALMKLDDGPSVHTAWDKFHWNGKKPKEDEKAKPMRGFYSLIPTEGLRPRAQVVAWISDADGKEHPYLVTLDQGKGRVIYLASGELWRLRQFDGAYYERIWSNLTEFARGRGEITSRSRLIVPERLMEGEPVVIHGILTDETGKPLTESARPILRFWSASTKNRKESTIAMKVVRANAALEGTFEATLPQLPPGTYHAKLEVPGMQIKAGEQFAIKSYYEAHKTDRVFHTKQQSLAHRSHELTSRLLTMSIRLSKEKDAELIKEGGWVREVVDIIKQEDLPVRYHRVIVALSQAKGLADFQNAGKASKDLGEKLQSLRTRVVGEKMESADALDAARLAERNVATLLEKTRAELHEASSTLADWHKYVGKSDFRLVRVHELIKDLSAARSVLDQGNARYRKATESLAKLGIRPQLMRYAELKTCRQLDEIVAQELDPALRLLAELRDQVRAKKDATKLADANARLAKSVSRLDAFRVTPIADVLAEFAALEREQARQTHALTVIRSRMEEELLKDLLPKK